MKMLFSLTVLLFSLSSMASSFKCVGTEPFWSLEITDKVIRYSDPVSQESYKVTQKKSAWGFSENAAFVIKTKYTSAAVTLGDCSDGMSDELYTYTIVFEKNDGVLAGCCNLE